MNSLLVEYGERVAKKDWAAADDRAERFLSSTPDAARFVAIAESAIRAGATDRAAAFLARAVAQFPNDIRLLLLRAGVLQQLGDVPAALGDYDAVLQSQPKHAEALSNRGVLLARVGKLPEAVESFRRATEAAPDFPDAHNNLGNALRDSGRLLEAVGALREAIRLRPDFPEAFNNLGVALALLQRYDEAISAYKTALAIRPAYLDALNNLGNVLQRCGRLSEAERCFRRACESRVPFPLAHVNLANLLAERRMFKEASEAYQKALAIDPQMPEAHYNLASLLAEGGRRGDARRHVERALAVRANYPEARALLGRLLRDAGDAKAGLKELEAALAQRPDDPELRAQFALTLADVDRVDEAKKHLRELLLVHPQSVRFHIFLGRVLMRAAAPRDAAACFQQALWRDSGSVEASEGLGLSLLQLNQPEAALGYLERARAMRSKSPELAKSVGNALRGLARYEEAIACFNESISLRPKFPEAFNDLGIAFTESGRLDDALAAFGKALELRPDYQDAAWNRSLTNLALGRYDEGLPEYEIRWRKPKAPGRPFVRPTWSGETIAGKTILVFAEQGLGDNIQFVRYLPAIKALGATVLFEAPPPLRKLLENFQGIDRLVSKEEVASGKLPFDVQLPLLSAPLVLGTRVESIPRETPYLDVDPAVVAAWSERLKDVEGVRIAIHWQGSPKFPGDRHRSVKLQRFAPLARIPGVKLISVQKGPGRRQIAEVRGQFDVLDFGDALDTQSGPFIDTAAILKNVDLMISADSAVIHLAGALGVPIWMVLPTAADWRWLRDREDSPWYPTMRLFRQREAGAWDDVFERAAAALVEAFPPDHPRRRMFEPQDAAALVQRGREARSRGRLQAAVGFFERAIARADVDPHALVELGECRLALRNPALARASFEEALADEKRAAAAFRGLGASSVQEGNLDEAIEHYDRAVAADPRDVESLVGRAEALAAAGRTNKALRTLDDALALAPDHVAALALRARLLLACGDFARGFEGFRFPKTPRLRLEAIPSWDGGALAGRTILVHADGGLRDAFQFARFVPPLARRGAKRVVFAVPRPVAKVFRRMPGGVQVIPLGDKLPPFDVAAPLSALPRLLGVRELANEGPWLTPEPGLLEYWRNEIAQLSGYKVAVAWGASGDDVDAERRSIPLRLFRELSQLPSVRLISLQKGPRARELYECAKDVSIVDLTPRLDERQGAFADTAAILRCVDLVVCGDNAIAELATALDVQAWVALPFASDWRWPVEGETTPWSPKTKLFRQNSVGDWSGPMERIFKELEERLQDVSGERVLVPMPLTEAIDRLARKLADRTAGGRSQTGLDQELSDLERILEPRLRRSPAAARQFETLRRRHSETLRDGKGPIR